MTDLSSPAQLGSLHQAIDSWLFDQTEANPAVRDVERDPTGDRRWFVRLIGEQRKGFTVVLRLGQRTTTFETYFMDLPEENEVEFGLHLLRRNARMYGASFVVVGDGATPDGPAVYIRGQIDNRLLAMDLDRELDRVLGSLYGWMEEYFVPALRIGYQSRFET